MGIEVGGPSFGDTVSPKNRVIRDVIEGLYDGRYKPGQRLVEMELTRRNGVSRGPVREALNRLAASGTVELTLQRGARVRALSAREAVGVLIVVQGLIALAAKLAAQEVDRGGNAAELVAALEAVERHDPLSMSADYAHARDAFYAALTGRSGNDELRRLMPSIAVHLIRVQFRATMTAADQCRHTNYRQIVDAIIGGQSEVAEAAARFHLQRSIDAVSRWSNDLNNQV